MLLLPAVGQTVFWVSGSGNYLWMACLQMLFCILFQKWIPNESNVFYVGLIPLAILVGNSQENSGPAIMIGVTLMCIFKYRYKFKLIKVLILDFFAVIGSLGSILSPGSMARFKETTGVSLWSEQHFREYLSLIIRQNFLFLALFVVFMMMFWKLRSMDKMLAMIKKATFTSIGIISVSTFTISLFLIFLSREMPGRTLFTGVTFGIIWILKLFDNSDYLGAFSLKIPVISGVLVKMLGIINLAYNYPEHKEITKTLIATGQNEEVVLSRENRPENQPIIVKMGNRMSALNGTHYFYPDKNAWFNKWASEYYHVKSIRIDFTLTN